MTTANQPGKIACPHCQGLIKAPALAAGSALNCPKCGKAFRLGQAAEAKQETGDRKQGTEDRTKPPAPPPSKAPSAQDSVPGTPPPVTGAKTQITKSESAPPSPKAKKPDNLVDPNLLPPPPPKVKEKPTDVAVVCNLCGTRIYVKLEKIGQEVKCPDCHSRNVVVGPKEEGAAKAKGPTLEGTENYGMSTVVERPKYRPLQAARGEYEVLSALDPAAIEQRLTVPGEKPRKKKLVAKPADDQGGEEDENEEHGEFTLEAPLERAEAARDPRSILPQPEIEPENALYDGRYDDGLIGDMVDPRAPDAWKKAPLVYGIIEFLFRPTTILRWVFFAILFTIVAGLAKLGVAYAQQAVVLFILWAGVPVLGVWLFSFAAAFHAIVEATGNGDDEVATWPDWNVFGWFGPALFVLLAAILSALPGGLIAAAIAVGIGEPMVIIFAIAAPVVLSMMLLFPFIYCSMLIEDNIFAFASAYTLRSLTIAGDAWMYFCMYSVGLVLLGTCAVGTLIANNMVFTAVGSTASIALLIIYARLIGRLMWVAAQRDAKYSG